MTALGGPATSATGVRAMPADATAAANAGAHLVGRVVNFRLGDSDQANVFNADRHGDVLTGQCILAYDLNVVVRVDGWRWGHTLRAEAANPVVSEKADSAAEGALTHSDRGLGYAEPVPVIWGGYHRGQVKVNTSSAATGAYIWLTATDDDKKVTAHLRAADALRLADRTIAVVADHYQLTGLSDFAAMAHAALLAAIKVVDDQEGQEDVEPWDGVDAATEIERATFVGEPVPWRVIMTDTEGMSGIAPVCPHQDDPNLHTLPDDEDAGRAFPAGVYDCCPGPHLEVWSVPLAAHLVDLLNREQS